MKKWLVFLITMSPGALLASQGGGINLTPNLTKFTSREITVSSTFTLAGGTFCVKDETYCLVFPSSAPTLANNHWIITSNVGKFWYVSWGGDNAGSGGGVGVGGSASLSVGTGSAVSLVVITSPTSSLNFSTPTFLVNLISPSTAFISLSTDAVALIFGTQTWLGAPNFSSVTFITNTTSVSIFMSGYTGGTGKADANIHMRSGAPGGGRALEILVPSGQAPRIYSINEDLKIDGDGSATKSLLLNTLIPPDGLGGGNIGIGLNNTAPKSLVDIRNGSVTIKNSLDVSFGVTAGTVTVTSTFTVTSSTIVIGPTYNFFPSTVPAGTADQILHRSQISSNTYWGGDNAGSGGVGGFTYNGTANTAFSTISLQGPFGLSAVASASGISTFTVLLDTNPYEMVSLPAASWMGCAPSSGSWENSGFTMNITTPGFNAFGDVFHKFRDPSISSSAVCTSFRMPYTWAGDSIAFQVSWQASTGEASTNMFWSMGAVALSSGTDAYSLITTTTSVFSTFVSSNAEIWTNPSAGFIPGGTARPGSRVKLKLFASGGNFRGFPLMTETAILYRRAFYDGRPR